MKRSLIYLTTKPRLVKRDGLWMCVGLSKSHWLYIQKVVTEYGRTAESAFEKWQHAVIRGKFQ